MATIDYKEKYEKAVHAAMLAKQDTESAVTVQTLEEIFPELRESEDERIRKEILTAFSSGHDNSDIYGHGITYGQVRAWLEKQGKNNMGISEATKQELEDNLNKALEKETPESWNKFLDEQKPEDKVGPRQEQLTKFEKAVKQVLEEAIECGDTHNLKADADMLLRLVQKSSWSEEDERRIEECAREAEDNNCIILARHIRQLKSLRLQSTWKPSGEQMDMLAKVCSTLHLTSGENEIMESIYDALKKLRKE